jgi:hypothetical protein
MIKAETEKEKFIYNEIWSNVFSASFSRNKVYDASFAEQEKANNIDHLKANLKETLRSYIDKLVLDQYEKDVSDKKHIENINSISTKSEYSKELLKNGQLNFGTAQKLLNLYLKYLWCLGFLKKSPPHFPLDRMIQEKLFKKVFCTWTKLEGKEGENEYMKIMDKARGLIKDKDNTKIAELELRKYQQ